MMTCSDIGILTATVLAQQTMLLLAALAITRKR